MKFDIVRILRGFALFVVFSRATSKPTILTTKQTYSISSDTENSMRPIPDQEFHLKAKRSSDGIASELHPRFVSISNSTDQICHGVLLTPNMVLTAAQCFFKPRAPNEVGSNFCKSVSGMKVESIGNGKSTISQVYRHAGFASNNNMRGSLLHDIAVAHLETPMTHIDKTIGLQKGALPVNGTNCWARSEGDKYTDDLHVRRFKVQKCKVTGHFGWGFHNTLCAPQMSKPGNAGGPVMCEDDGGRLYLAGIMSQITSRQTILTNVLEESEGGQWLLQILLQNVKDSPEFACEDGSRCIPSSRFCDGRKDCEDGSDEISVNSTGPGTPCRQDKFICLLPSSQLGKESVFCIKNVTCSDEEFPCADNAGCLPTSWFCDGRQDCRDGSDDKRILTKPADGFQICNGRHHFSSDPLKCEVPTNYTCPKQPFCLSNSADFLDGKCFRCLQYPYIVIPIAKLCNGVIDCPDLSDECMCKTENRAGICEKVSWENDGDEDSQIKRPAFTCQSGNGSEKILAEDVCNVRVDCADRIDEEYCNTVGERTVKYRNYTCRFDENIHKKASRCDGVPECKDDVFNEECNCPDRPNFCNFTESRRDWSFLSCNTTNDWNKVHRTGFVHGTSICDGVAHCLDEEDELYCSNRTHFYCAKRLPSFIPRQKKCDRVVDCADESDESSCNFKCPGNNPVRYIGDEQVCDGVQNCAEGKDECQPNCIISTFSNNSTMIKDTPVLVCLLFISTFALSGNSLVILATLRDFFFPKKKPFVRDNKKAQRQRILINRVLILNLALSDLLVGIYTFAICIKNLVTDGEYCLVDRDWRSGTTCSVLGALLVIGSEQSVFTMILVTASRLYDIRRMLSDMPLKRLFTAVGLAWIVSITLAVIPLLPSLEDTFTTSIWYGGNALFATIEQNDIKNITFWLLTMANSTGELHGDIGSWGSLEYLIGKLSPNLTVGRKYGFYSSHTVCIPDLFPDRVKNASWWYSLLLIHINFLAFVFILVGCFLIYRHAARKNPARSVKQQTAISSRMQKKLTVIVITDFLCWIPVCIMAFLQLSGVTIPQDWRLIVGLIIIPINSAVNPVIYSNLPEMIWAKTRGFRVRIYSCGENCIRERPLPPAADPEVIQEETAM